MAQCLARQLGYPLLGREVTVEAAAKLGVSEEALTRKFERSPGFWGRLTADRRLYVVAVQAVLAEHAASGDLVYHGHAGHLLLHGIPNVLRVRLIAPLPMRIRAVRERQGLTEEAAGEYIRNVDEDRVRWTRFIYGVDWSDPALYDVVVNLERMAIPTACAVVANISQQAEYASTEEARRKLADFLLSCRVKVALASSPQTRAVPVEATAEDGVVALSGEMPTTGILSSGARDQDQILRIAQSVPGVRSVSLSIRKFDPYH
jgi:cytidylate kinase